MLDSSLLLLALAVQPVPAAARESAPAELAVREIDAAYVAAWLRNDQRAVLATLADDAVLMPAGQYPLATANHIRQFWWPADGSITRILSFHRTIDELVVVGDAAYARGSDTVTFTYDMGSTHTEQTSQSMTLTVYRRQGIGPWRISRMMWGTRSK